MSALAEGLSFVVTLLGTLLVLPSTSSLNKPLVLPSASCSPSLRSSDSRRSNLLRLSSANRSTPLDAPVANWPCAPRLYHHRSQPQLFFETFSSVLYSTRAFLLWHRQLASGNSPPDPSDRSSALALNTRWLGLCAPHLW
jgi:hypothetical protein